MRNLVWLAVALATGTGIASAQPGPDPNAPPPLPPDPNAPPPPGPSGPPGATWQPAPYQPGYPQDYPRLQLQQLAPDDQHLLARGEITDGQWIGGGVASILVGFGVGQAVQGRWGERGWIFTLGDAALGTVAMVSIGYTIGCSVSGTSCNTAIPVMYGSVLALAAFRVLEVADAFAVPPARNARLRRLRMELGLPQVPSYALAPYLAPTRSLRGDTAVAGFQVSF
jgi:hypothetical protein